MLKGTDFSVFMKYGDVLFCFFLCCLFQFESIRGKRQNKTQGRISHSTVCTFDRTVYCVLALRYVLKTSY